MIKRANVRFWPLADMACWAMLRSASDPERTSDEWNEGSGG